MDFRQVIAPLTTDTFVGRYLGKDWLLAEGPSDRYSSLLSWAELNDTLNHFRATASAKRLRLVQGGKALDPARYLCPSDGNNGSQLHAVRFEECLMSGATLVLDFVDELFPMVRELAETTEIALDAQVKVNLYAGWRLQNGFDLHWDPHDTLILQVYGRKKWTVYAPTREYPLGHDVAAGPAPSAEPLWEGTLEPGSMLYMPRGWWHVAFPLDECTLHLTIGITRPTGADFLRWLANELKAQDRVRMDLPLLPTADSRSAYIDQLRPLVVESLTAELVKKFVHQCDSNIASRPCMSLPDVACTGGHRIDEESRIRLSNSRRIVFAREDHGRDRIEIDGISFNVGPHLEPALALLTNRFDRTFRELRAAVSSEYAGTLKVLLTKLSLAGVLIVRTSITADLPIIV